MKECPDSSVWFHSELTGHPAKNIWHMYLKNQTQMLHVWNIYLHLGHF